MWGLLPLYWQTIVQVPVEQIIAHRIIWSCFWLTPVIWFGGFRKSLWEAVTQPKVILKQTVAAILVCANWLCFVWAVTHDRVLESSLGYFINPLMSVLLGVLLLGEKLRRGQQLAILVAAGGLYFLTRQFHGVPWIALSLAVSFCLYGFAKKTTSLHPVVSLSIETFVLLIPSLFLLAIEHSQGRGAFGHFDRYTDCVLIGGGLATTIPLLCFAAGAQRIPLSAIGMLQYIGPTIQFTLGTVVNHEPFDQWKLIGFGLVWCACLLYTSDSWRAYQQKQNMAPQLPESPD